MNSRQEQKGGVAEPLSSRKLWSVCILSLSLCSAQGWTSTEPLTVASPSASRRRESEAKSRQWLTAENSRNEQDFALPYRPDTSQTIRTLIDMLEEQECEGLEAIELGYNEHHHGLRGMHAKIDFGRGEYICALPFPSALLIEDSLESSTDGIFATIEDSDLRQGLRFLQEFVRDDKASTIWKPYLDTLPTPTDAQFDATPDFWAERVMEELQVPRLMKESLQRKQEIARVAHEAGVAVDDLQWATWVGRTRGFSTFKVLRNEKGDEATLQQRTVLLPLLDMLNHNGVSPNASIEVVESPGSFEDSFCALRALVPISAGDEITISYGTGRETCLDLMSKYGFWLPFDPADEFMLDWSSVDPQWTTTLEQDEATLQETTDLTLRKALSLRVYLKQLQKRAYSNRT